MKPALATVCSLEASLATVLEDYAAGHVTAVDLWLGHADAFLRDHDPAALRLEQSGHGVEHAGLARARRPEQRGQPVKRDEAAGDAPLAAPHEYVDFKGHGRPLPRCRAAPALRKRPAR